MCTVHGTTGCVRHGASPGGNGQLGVRAAMIASSVCQRRLLLLRIALTATLWREGPGVAWAETLAWGDASYGGQIPAATQASLNAAAGVTHLASTSGAFVARTTDGVWLAWGDESYGGQIPADTQASLDAAAGVTHLASTSGAFVARTTDGVWLAWGDESYGGQIPADTQASLDAAAGVTHLASTSGAFVARTTEVDTSAAETAGEPQDVDTKVDAATENTVASAPAAQSSHSVGFVPLALGLAVLPLSVLSLLL